MKMKFVWIIAALMISAAAHAQLGMGLVQDPAQQHAFKVKAPDKKGYGSEVPSSYSLKMYTPYVKSQGQYGTCAAWASSYSAYTTQYAEQIGLTDRTLITALSFCPYYVYNKANGDMNCNAGTSLETILGFMAQSGAKRFYMPVIGCGTAITPSMDEDASRYLIRDAYYLYDAWQAPADNSAAAVSDFLLHKPQPNIDNIKAAVASGFPVIFGGYVAGSFTSVYGMSDWQATDEERTDPGQAVIDNTGMHRQHAMCIIGYDDNRNGGSFEIMNSWSELWGDHGYVWVKYEDWALFNYCAFYLDIGIMQPESLISEGCANGDCTNGYGIYKYAGGERYEGHFVNGMRNGYGIYTWPGGTAYAGEWANDKRNGEAIVYLANGNYGTCTYKDDAQSTGYGDWVYNNGDKYTGSLDANYIRNGYGVYTYTDGRKYSGAHVDNAFSGLGKMEWPNGDKYIGEFSDNDMNGYGSYIFANGTVKSGIWSDGVLKSGQNFGYAHSNNHANAQPLNLFTAVDFATADCITGDCLNGPGKKKYSTGVVYDGEFKDALEDGYGTMEFTDGMKLTGYFTQGNPNGIYKLVFANGDVRIVESKAGQPDGYMLTVYTTGEILVQYFSDGMYLRDAVPSGDASGFQPVPNQFGSSPRTLMTVSKSK